MQHNVLQEFQEFLSASNLVQKKYIPYYAYWSSKFLTFSNKNKELKHDLQVQKFLDDLRDNENADWQIRQAHDAIRLYFNHYKNNGEEDMQAKHLFSDINELIEKMRQAIRIRHYSYRTEKTYIDWTKRFLNYIREANDDKKADLGLDSNDVKNYLTYLALKKRVSASTQNQAFNSILFFFRYVINNELSDLGNTVRAKRGRRLPVVLSVEEVKELFKYVEGINLLIVQVLYGAGLRLMEVLRLRVKDIDFGSDLIFIRDGKGGEDRTTVLPDTVREPLKRHLRAVNVLHEQDLASGYGEVYLPNALERKYPNAPKEWHWQYLFPSSRLSAEPVTGKIRRHHIYETTVQRAIKSAVRKAGIAKHVSVHTLRHSFATHLLMSGVNIREIQQLLGHKNVETTMIYTHVLRDVSKVPQSPLDAL